MKKTNICVVVSACLISATTVVPVASAADLSSAASSEFSTTSFHDCVSSSLDSEKPQITELGHDKGPGISEN